MAGPSGFAKGAQAFTRPFAKPAPTPKPPAKARGAPAPKLSARPLSAGRAFSQLSATPPRPARNLMTQPPPGIRTAPPKGGPLASVLGQQRDVGPGITGGRLKGGVIFQAGATPVKLTQPPLQGDMRTLVNQAKTAPDSVPQTVRDQLVGRGYLIKDAGTYRSGPRDVLGSSQDAMQVFEKGRSGSSVVPKSPLSTAAGAIQAVAGTANANSLLGRAYNNLISLPQQTAPALAATFEHPVATAQGLLHAVEHPAQTFSQDPATALAMLLGPVEGASRLAGGLARSGALGEGAAAAASTERAPVNLIPETRTPTGGIKPAVELKRTYSPSVLQKGGQVAAEHILGGLGDKVDRGLTGGGGLGLGGTLRRPGLVHFHAAQAEIMRRQAAQAAVHYAHGLRDVHGVPKGAEHAIPLAVEGTLKTPASLSEDLGKRLDMLRSEGEKLKGTARRLNQRAQTQVQSLIDNKALHANPHPVFSAAKDFADWHAPLEQMLVDLGHIEPGQLNAKYVPYAISQMGAKYDPANTFHNGLTVDGDPLKLADIQVHMKANGMDRQPGFLTHKDNNSFQTATRSRQGSRPGGDYQMRTGVNYRRGTYEMRYPALGLQGYRSANLIAGHQNENRLLNRFAVGYGKGLKDARARADQFSNSPEGEKLAGLGNVVARPIGSARVRSRGLVTPRDTRQVLQGLGLEPHFEPPSANPEEATHALVPAKVLDAINQHNQMGQQKFLSGLRWYTNKWRQAQLYTSPRWLFGSPQEHAIRLAAANINPLAIAGVGSHAKIGRTAETAWQQLANDTTVPPEVRDTAREHLSNSKTGTQYGSQAMNEIRTEVQRAFNASGPMGRLSRFGDWLQNDSYARKPTSAVLNGWKKWKAGVGTMMSAVEHNSKLAAYGKVAHNELRGFTGQWSGVLAHQDHIVTQWAHGKVDPNDVAHLGNEVMRMMGNWTHLTPGARTVVQTVSPFGLWWANSLKFVTDVMPRDHPFKVATLAALEAATVKARAAQGQGYDPQTGQPLGPSYLQGSPTVNIPLLGHVGLGSEYYSPNGIAIQPPQTAMSMLLPQLTDAYLTARGIDPLTGQPLENAQKQTPSAPVLGLRAAQGAAVGAIPGARQAIALATGGGKPNVTSPFVGSTGPGKGFLPTLLKTLLPLKTTAEPKGAKGSGSGGFTLPPAGGRRSSSSGFTLPHASR